MVAIAIFKKTALAGVFALASLTAASAATTIVADEAYVGNGGKVSNTSSNYQYNYLALQDLAIDGFALGAVGHSSDISKIKVSFIPDSGESTILVPYGSGTNVFGGGFLSGLTMRAGDAFSILFEVLAGGSLTRAVGVQVAFDTTTPPPAPIPVPAAGLLLVSALGAAGFTLRRRKKTR